MDDSSINENDKRDFSTSEEKLLKQTQDRQEYMMKLKEWLDGARLWHFNLCGRIPSNISSSNSNFMDSVLEQYTSLSQANRLHQHFQNVLYTSYLNSVNRNIQNSRITSE